MFFDVLVFGFHQKRRKTHSIIVGKNCEVVPLDVHEAQDDIFPPINHEKIEVFLDAITVDGIRRVDCAENDIVEEGLESGDGSPLVDEESRESVRGSDAKGENLSADTQLVLGF
jgi:hypothetical protein